MKSKKLSYNKILVLFCIIAVSVLMTGCDGDDGPIVLNFSASPSTINPGESSTLTWAVSDADTVTITPGLGTVDSGGSTSVSPVVTTVYTLTATNSAESVTATVTITVVTECIDFESLTIGKVYNVGDTFTDSGVTITVLPFQLGNGSWTSDGFAQVVDNGCAGVSGKEINVKNVNLGFNFSGPLKGLSLNFGEYGGNNNIALTDDFPPGGDGWLLSFENFDDINGISIGGVDVSVINGYDNDKGRLILSGEMGMFDFNGQDFMFVIGGQGLCVDHVCTFDPTMVS